MDRQSLIRALRDTAQSASNAVASNVSGPVDLLAAGLRGVGLPIPESPVGGSQWMRDRGLTAPVQQGAAQVVGETLGMAGPALAANFAPQIARAANSLDDKAMDMARQGIEGQMVRSGFIQPATVWHGSPHKFDKFDSSKIGTGEGAQAYGHGLYLAESPDVAKSYLATGQAVKANDRPTEMVARAIDAAGGDEAGARAWLQNRLDTSLPEYKKLYSSALSGFDSLKPQGSSLYKVDLPDDAIAKMLDWDKPLSQQAPEIVGALREGYKKSFGVSDRYLDDMLHPGATVKSAIGGGQMSKAMTENLQQLGIPGIRYLDGGSRGTGSGTSNFVVFPGNENILKILERNGQPLGMMGIK